MTIPREAFSGPRLGNVNVVVIPTTLNYLVLCQKDETVSGLSDYLSSRLAFGPFLLLLQSLFLAFRRLSPLSKLFSLVPDSPQLDYDETVQAEYGHQSPNLGNAHLKIKTILH